jgi:hypothetical protein
MKSNFPLHSIGTNLIFRSTYEMASCSRMRSIYTQAFEGTACTDSSGSLALLFLIMFAISLIGMVIIMLRSSMYPFKKVFPFSSFYEEENKLDEHPACLQYVSTFPDKWGDNDGASPSKPVTFETSSVSDSVSNTRTSMNLDVAPESLSIYNSNDDVESAPNIEDERNAPLSSTFPDKWSDGYGAFPSKPDTFETSSASASDSCTSTSGNLDMTPESQSIYNAAEEAESAPNIEDERNAPLSSPDTELFVDQSQMYTSDSMHTSNGEGYVNCTPTSPQTPSNYSGMRSRRFATPEFLTPGTFRRWRRRDEKDVRTGDEIPEAPLMISPKDHHYRVSYISSFLSPLKIGFHQYDTREDKSK